MVCSMLLAYGIDLITVNCDPSCAMVAILVCNLETDSAAEVSLGGSRHHAPNAETSAVRLAALGPFGRETQPKLQPCSKKRAGGK